MEPSLAGRAGEMFESIMVVMVVIIAGRISMMWQASEGGDAVSQKGRRPSSRRPLDPGENPLTPENSLRCKTPIDSGGDVYAGGRVKRS